jgi:hypothetical protein
MKQGKTKRERGKLLGPEQGVLTAPSVGLIARAAAAATPESCLAISIGLVDCILVGKRKSLVLAAPASLHTREAGLL